jgi:hypothetical protein
MQSRASSHDYANNKIVDEVKTEVQNTPKFVEIERRLQLIEKHNDGADIRY